jgi:hypothetical protein
VDMDIGNSAEKYLMCDGDDDSMCVLVRYLNLRFVMFRELTTYRQSVCHM